MANGNIPTSGSVDIVIQMPSESGGNVGDTVGEGAASPANPQQEGGVSSNPVTPTDKNKQVKLATAIQAAKSVGTQALNAAVSNIGLATGNYYAQARAQEAISGINTVIGLAMSAANPVTFGVAIAGMAISAGSEIYRQEKQREHDNYVAAQNARRLGFSEFRK